ncbi:MAG: TIR domain-containing protein [Pirellulales bacterium]
MKVYEANDRIRIWYDRNLMPGMEWEQELYTHFCSAQIILILMSEISLPRKRCSKRELPASAQRHARKSAKVVPIIIRPCRWQPTKLAALMVLPRNGNAIDLWDNKRSSVREHCEGTV